MSDPLKWTTLTNGEQFLNLNTFQTRGSGNDNTPTLVLRPKSRSVFLGGIVQIKGMKWKTNGVSFAVRLLSCFLLSALLQVINRICQFNWSNTIIGSDVFYSGRHSRMSQLDLSCCFKNQDRRIVLSFICFLIFPNFSFPIIFTPVLLGQSPTWLNSAPSSSSGWYGH